MEFKHVEYFVETCNYGSISDAARSLYISQQALSRCIANLEKELECTLFTRTSRGIELTPNGRYLYDQFRPLVMSYYENVKIASAHFKNQPISLPFCCGPGIVRNISPELLISFSDQNPEIKLDMIELADVDCEQYISEDRLRFGLMVAPKWKHKQAYDYIIIKTEPTFLLVHKSHPFAGLTSVSLRMLRNEKVLALSKTSFYQNNLNHALEPYNFSLTPYYESSDVSQLCSLVTKGKGVLLCIQQIYDEADQNEVALIPIEERNYDYNIAFVFQRFDALDSIAKRFIRFVIENINK